jgi:hypothetical protein
LFGSSQLPEFFNLGRNYQGIKHPRDEIREVTEGEGVNCDTPNFLELLTCRIIKSYEPRSNAELHNFPLQADAYIVAVLLPFTSWTKKGEVSHADDGHVTKKLFNVGLSQAGKVPASLTY